MPKFVTLIYYYSNFIRGLTHLLLSLYFCIPTAFVLAARVPRQFLFYTHVHRCLFILMIANESYLFVRLTTYLDLWPNLYCVYYSIMSTSILPVNPLNPELNPICYLLALLGTHHFLHVSRIRVKSLKLRWLMSYIYGAPILDVSRSHKTTQHSR